MIQKIVLGLLLLAAILAQAHAKNAPIIYTPILKHPNYRYMFREDELIGIHASSREKVLELGQDKELRNKLWRQGTGLALLIRSIKGHTQHRKVEKTP